MAMRILDAHDVLKYSVLVEFLKHDIELSWLKL